jgi:hypothetical protein
MATAKFARCFLLPDGNVCCEHWNGSYIVFPAYGRKNDKKETTPSFEEEEVSEE